MQENQISGSIIDASLRIHKELGIGLFESVYEEILAFELTKLGFLVQRQHPIPVVWKNIRLDQGFRADLIVERKVVVEIKSIEALAPIHTKQLITYLKLSGLKLGLLINFNTLLLKDGIIRLVNNL